MKRLLLVDDDPDILLGLQIALEDSYQLHAAANGAEALAALESEAFDAVVLDVMMPVIDGPGVIEGMRRRGLHVPVVLVSAGLDLAREAGRLGVDEQLAKPYELSDLEAAIARALGASSGGGRAGGSGGGGGLPSRRVGSVALRHAGALSSVAF